MNQYIEFPRVVVSHNGEGFEAVAGIRLKSILKGNLLLTTGDFSSALNPLPYPLDPRFLHQARTALLHAIEGWKPSVTLELHLTALPNLTEKSHSQLMIALLIRCAAATKHQAQEEIYSRYLHLMPLLASHCPEAEFKPIIDENNLAMHTTPFAPQHAVSIQRRQELLSLSIPVKRFSVGFDARNDNWDTLGESVNHVFPWRPSFDDWSRLANTLLGQLDPLQIIIRLRPGANTTEAVESCREVISSCERFLAGIDAYQLTLNLQATLIRDLALEKLSYLTKPCFSLAVLLLAPGPIDSSLVNVTAQAIAGALAKNDGGCDFSGGFSISEIDVHEALKRGFFPESEPFSPDEAACAFRLPSPPLGEQPGIPVRRSRTAAAFLPPKGENPEECITLAINEHLGLKQAITMSVDDRMRHLFVIGQTGVGKSTLMETAILQDIRAGRGVAVIDPHGEMAESLLGKIPKERAEDVILFDLLDRKQPIGFNLLQWNTLEERDLIIDELYLTLDRIYDMRQSGGPIFESNFRGMLKLLMGDRKRADFVPTLLEFTLCYQSKRFRQCLKSTVQDPQVQDFLEELEETHGEGSINNLSPYITSKFSRFINDTSLQRIIGQEKSGFDFENIMNSGKIFLAKLGKGRFGSVVSALLANQMVSRFKFAAMKRGEMPRDKRRDFFLYVDEAHNLPAENFMELLSEARKYRMGLTLSTQYTAQLGEPGGKKNDLLAAILGNVGTLALFRLGNEDSSKLAPVLSPIFNAQDISGLPNWQGYLRTQTGRDFIPPFSFRTEPDKTPFNQVLAERIRYLSQLKYGKEATLIDKEIIHRRTWWKQEKTTD